MTAGNIFGNVNNSLSEDEVKTDLYRPTYEVAKVKALMEHGVEEYNKSQPRIKLALYRVSRNYEQWWLHYTGWVVIMNMDQVDSLQGESL